MCENLYEIDTSRYYTRTSILTFLSLVLSILQSVQYICLINILFWPAINLEDLSKTWNDALVLYTLKRNMRGTPNLCNSHIPQKCDIRWLLLVLVLGCHSQIFGNIRVNYIHTGVIFHTESYDAKSGFERCGTSDTHKNFIFVFLLLNFLEYFDHR